MIGPALIGAVARRRSSSAIPSSAILDDFNRANENPLSDGGNWTAHGSLAALQLASQIVSTSCASLERPIRTPFSDVRPDLERDDPAGVTKVVVSREHRQLVADAELGQQGVDRPQLDATTAAPIPEVGRGDVVVAVGNQERQRRETIEDRVARLGSLESLQQLLEDETGREDRSEAFERRPQVRDGRMVRMVPSQRMRPDAGIDEQVHDRERSAL